MEIKINQLDRNTEGGGVITVHWTVFKTQGEHTASQYGTEGFQPDPAAADFKPYEQLTEQDVKNWLTERWTSEGVAAKEAALDAQLQQLASPPVQSGLPWAPATPAQ